MKAGHGMRSTELHYHFAGVNFPEMSWLGPVRSGLSLIAVLDKYIHLYIDSFVDEHIPAKRTYIGSR